MIMNATSGITTMECLSPITLRNPRWLNGDVTAKKWLVVPCGKCPACKFNKTNEWAFRIKQEAKCHINNYFFTLTYDAVNEPWEENEQGDYVPCVSKDDIQKFLKRVRIEISRKVKGFTGLRYVVVSEYGPKTLRPHYHGILFGVPEGYPINLQIQKSWPYGFVQCGFLQDGGCHYCAKYLFKKQPEVVGLRSNFMLCSRKPALGSLALSPRLKQYIHDSNEKSFPLAGGSKFPLPRIFATKIFSERELRKIGEKNSTEQERHFQDKIDYLVNAGLSPVEASERIRRNSQEQRVILNKKINKMSKKHKDL